MDFKGFYDEIIFDVDRPILKSYTGKQGDTKSRGLYVTVTQKNAVIEDLTGLSMSLFYEKPDKTRGFIDGVVDGNKFRIDYTNQMYAVPGVVKAELRLMGSDGEIITAKTFKILVDSSIADGSIISENERGILDRAFELAEDIIPRLELLDVELLEDVQAEMLGARHSNTKDETYENLGDRLDAAEQDLLDHKAEYTSNRQQDQLKIAKVEKELNDYKATMQQVNINQEPKQKAAGYGVISLPPNAADGQISGVLYGLTATNIIKNGNFLDGTSGWGVHDNSATLSVSNNTLIATGTGNFANVVCYRGFNANILQTGHKYYVRAILRVTNSECTRIMIDFRSSALQAVASQNNPVANQWYTLSGIITALGTYAGPYVRITCYYPDAATAAEKVTEVREVIAIDLTVHGLENKTKEELDRMFPYYWNGTKSTIGAVRIKSVGKNLFDGRTEDIGKLISMGSNTLTTDASLPNARTTKWIKCEPNKTYVVSGGDRNRWQYMDNNGIVYWGINASTFTTPSNAKAMRVYYSSTGLHQIQIEKGTVATSYEPYKESNVYVIAKDEEGNILELRSLPNGTKDEIRVSGGKLVKRVSDEVFLDGSEHWTLQSINEYGIANFRLEDLNTTLPNASFKPPHEGKFTVSGFKQQSSLISNTTEEGFLINDFPSFYIRLLASKLSQQNVTGFKAWLQANPVTVTYQLAEPIEIPVQVSGTLTSYSNGTVYMEPFVADAGVYTDKIKVLHQDLPIKAIEKVSKVDFMTGVETELDINQAEISEDKLSFTHPELNAGDIVFFEYEYDVESTDGEAEVEFYDSRYVVKDDVTGKFYKWNVKVSNGTPTIEVVEV